jgi:GntR family transcriptional regulator, rspAB operon transcriptional repressor
LSYHVLYFERYELMINLECLEKTRGESAREYVTRILRSNILNLNLIPGQSISENEVAELLKMSRTPVREAFIRLFQDNLIEIYPQKGTYVSKINLNYVEEGWFARITFEKAIIKLVCEHFVNEGLIKSLEENLHMQDYYIGTKDLLKVMHLDETFHRSLYKACGKERTYSAIEGLNYDYYRVRILSLTSKTKLENVFSQHAEIKNAIKERDIFRADKAVEDHLLSVKFDEEILKSKYSHYLM